MFFKTIGALRCSKAPTVCNGNLRIVSVRSHNFLQGAFVFRDSMIDMPLVRQARNILQTVQAVDDHRESSEKVDDVVQGEDSTEKADTVSQGEDSTERVVPKDESPKEADGEKKWTVSVLVWSDKFKVEILQLEWINSVINTLQDH